MFTGIVLGTRKVAGVRKSAAGAALEVALEDLAGRVAVGGSVALSGVCLSAVSISGSTARFDVVPETLARTTIGDLRPGDEVNVELPLAAGDPLGGHFVQGHVDGVGTVRSVVVQGDQHLLTVALPRPVAPLVVEKGSLAIDGVSLTVVETGAGAVSVALIPHTLEITTLGRARPGSRLNIEIDYLARMVFTYLQRFEDPGFRRR